MTNTIMISVAISKAWFEDVKNLITFEDPYFYTMFTTRDEEMVELDVIEEEFNRISKERGWMI